MPAKFVKKEIFLKFTLDPYLLKKDVYMYMYDKLEKG